MRVAALVAALLPALAASAASPATAVLCGVSEEGLDQRLMDALAWVEAQRR